MGYSRLASRVLTVFNPLPGITEKDVCEHAGLPVPRAGSDKPVFSMALLWSAGADKEFLAIAPGETRAIGEEYARQLERDHREEGLVIVEDFDGDKEAAQIEGFHHAIEFYRTNGLSAIMEHRLGRSDDEWAQVRRQFPGNVKNEAKAEMLDKLVSKLQERHGAKSKNMVRAAS